MLDLKSHWRKSLIHKNSSIKDAIAALDSSASKILMIVSEDMKLDGVISDGDIRRALLHGAKLDNLISDIIEAKPLTAAPNLSKIELEQMMLQSKIQQIPQVDYDGRVTGLYTWESIFEPTDRLESFMVIMAGGFGKRMLPYTEHTPKPMLLIMGKPILQHIIERAKLNGIFSFIISLHYKSNVIRDYFGDGSRFGIQITYLEESAPLGTAGALGLLKVSNANPIIVSNGDLLADINYKEILDFHKENQADATMCIRRHVFEYPYGVIRTQDLEIVRIDEKPKLEMNVNTGIYVFSLNALSVLNQDEQCDMPEFFLRLKDAGKRCLAYKFDGSWTDVGRPEDLRRINELVFSQME